MRRKRLWAGQDSANDLGPAAWHPRSSPASPLTTGLGSRLYAVHPATGPRWEPQSGCGAAALGQLRNLRPESVGKDFGVSWDNGRRGVL